MLVCSYMLVLQCVEQRRIGLWMVSITCGSFGDVVLDLTDVLGGSHEVLSIIGGVLGVLD